MDFEAFPKIPRLNRDITVTEKIDGSNAAILIEETTDYLRNDPDVVFHGGYSYRVQAQSRKRLIQPNSEENKGADNYGFAGWVRQNAAELVRLLGPGRHFGEWWGTGINRGYGLTSQRRFSLFRPGVVEGEHELGPVDGMTEPTIVSTVPVLYEGPFDSQVIADVVANLHWAGSVAAPGFSRPEGVIVYHTAANQLFKVTCVDDEKPKEVAAREAAKVAANGGGKAPSIHWGGDGV